MSLYNLKSADGQWRITKFTNDLDVESSYLLSESECACPAGSRPTCRHRQMLPKMLEVGAEDSGLFYDFDSDKFFEPLSDTDPELTDVTSLIAEHTFAEDVASAASGSSDTKPEPYGKSPGLDELLAESRADNERMRAKIIANEVATAGRSAELVEPTLEPEPKLSGLQEEQILMGFHQPELCKAVGAHTSRFESNHVEEIEERYGTTPDVHPSIGHIKRRV